MMATKTVVMNLLDDRTSLYDMPPDNAVVAAYEQFERNNFAVASYPDPHNHPNSQSTGAGTRAAIGLPTKIRMN